MKLLNEALGHATGRAVSMLKDRKRALRLLDSTLRHLSRAPAAINAKGLTVKMRAASRMVRLSVRREYRDVPWQSLVLITAGFIYFVSPADAIPDFIPLLGFTDDAAILAAIFASISSDLEKFIEWERARSAESAESKSPESPERV